MDKITKKISELSLMVECEECKMQFNISSQDAINCVKHKKEYKINERSIFLTYYDCPNCGKRHFVQIDDDYTLKILKDVKKIFTKMAANRVKNKIVPKSQSDKYKRQIKHLRSCRNKLMKEFTGVILHDDETDTSFELRFSV